MYFSLSINLSRFAFTSIYIIYIHINVNIRLIKSTDKKFINTELALLFKETCKS